MNSNNLHFKQAFAYPKPRNTEKAKNQEDSNASAQT